VIRVVFTVVILSSPLSFVLSAGTTASACSRRAVGGPTPPTPLASPARGPAPPFQPTRPTRPPDAHARGPQVLPGVGVVDSGAPALRAVLATRPGAALPPAPPPQTPATYKPGNVQTRQLLGQSARADPQVQARCPSRGMAPPARRAIADAAPRPEDAEPDLRDCRDGARGRGREREHRNAVQSRRRLPVRPRDRRRVHCHGLLHGQRDVRLGANPPARRPAPKDLRSKSRAPPRMRAGLGRERGWGGAGRTRTAVGTTRTPSTSTRNTPPPVPPTHPPTVPTMRSPPSVRYNGGTCAAYELVPLIMDLGSGGCRPRSA